MASPAFSLVVSVPMLLSAAGGGVEVDINPTLVLAQLGLLLFAFLVLKPFLFEPLMALYDERELRGKGAKLAAARMDDQAADLLRSYEDELAHVRNVAAEERDRARVEVQALENKILQDARAETAQVLTTGRQKISEEAALVEKALPPQIEEMARQMATRILDREVRS